MNKKVILGALGIVVACLGTIVMSNYAFNQSTSSDLDLANVEALSAPDPGIYLPCYTKTNSECKINAHTADSQGVIKVPNSAKMPVTN